MLRYSWWLEAYKMHPRDVDDLWEDEDYWLPLVKEARDEVARMRAAEEASQHKG